MSLLVNQAAGAAPCGSEAQPTVAVTGAGVHLHVGLMWPPSGGGVHGHTLPRRVAAPPQVLRNLRVQMAEGGLAGWDTVLVGASPVVDYFTFVLENLANSALHRVSGRSASAVRPQTREILLKCGANRREVFML